MTIPRRDIPPKTGRTPRVVMKSKHHFGFGVFILCIACFLCGCALLKLKQDIDRGKSASLLQGCVIMKSEQSGPIFIVAYERIHSEINVCGHVRLSQTGCYELLVPNGKYYVGAFQDVNGNGKHDPNEAVGQFGTPDLVDAKTKNNIDQLNIVLNPPEPDAVSHLSGISINKTDIVDRAVAGEVADRDRLARLDSYASQGYWEPISAFNEVGANIWFVQPYDPKKIPVLFIHGASGTASGWEFLFQKIDRSVFQPCFFYYPSGLDLEFSAYILASKILRLHAKYRFDRMAVVAHSMGGLVARSCMTRFRKYFPFIKLFVSISTPWGGVNMAKMGAENSPVVIPAWKDVASGSDFISTLYQNRLPQNTRFYLLFSYRGNRNPFEPNNDGTLTMESMLDQRAQQEAVRIYGVNQDHAGILNSQETATLLNDIIEQEMPEKKGLKQSGTISISVDLKSQEHRPNIVYMLLILETLGKKFHEKVIYLDPFQKEQTIDGIPDGEYLASLLIPAFHVIPIRKAIRVRAGQTTSIRFGGSPEGIITNFIWSASGLHAPKKIVSINLYGAGVDRTILPDNFAFNSIYDAALSQKDFFHDNLFCFYGLAEGIYRVTVVADGYRAYSENYRVTPGQFGNIPHIQLSRNLRW
ncbi:alpha/beta hydrolase [Desulfosarcina variabilis]|uniref:alpha/beta hydrolase n=1 Tax=Desulfosarcina variabilis TaxID=2300 RepID=UPI003AFB29B2